MANKKKKQDPKQSAQQLLKSFGSRIGGKEVKTFETQFPNKPLKSVTKYAKKEKGVKLGPNAKKYINSKKPIVPGDLDKSGGGNANDQSGGGIFDVVAGHEIDVANIYADADKYIADAEVRGIDISSGRALEGTKYAADKESEWRQAVANIEVKGRLDLQPIINAGLEKVAGIEAQAQRDVADITGKYDVEGIRVRGEADKQIGGMQLAGNMYNLINAAFG
jgi:hypothetical protein